MNYKEQARRLKQAASGPHAKIMRTSADAMMELLERAKTAERQLLTAKMKIEMLRDRLELAESCAESSKVEARTAIKSLYTIRDCRTCLYEYGKSCLMHYDPKEKPKDCPYSWKG